MRIEDHNKAIVSLVDGKAVGETFSYSLNGNQYTMMVQEVSEDVESNPNSYLIHVIELGQCFFIMPWHCNYVVIKFNNDSKPIGFIHSLLSFIHFTKHNINVEYLDIKQFGKCTLAFHPDIQLFAVGLK